MSINFSAEHMQGYNNPEIEIVNVELDETGALTTPITFDDIAKILARGVFPILSAWGAIQGERIGYIMPLSFARDNEILFNTIYLAGTLDSPTGAGIGCKFSTSGPPVLLQMPLQRGPNTP